MPAGNGGRVDHMGRFDGKVILVTGVTSGIGLGAAEYLAQEGATILGVGRNEDTLKATLSKMPGTTHGLVADVSDESCIDLIARAGKSLGGLSGAVLCAGVHDIRPFKMANAEHFIDAFRSNVVTATNCTRAVAKSVAPGGASVIWFSSLAATKATAGFAAYAASKAAVTAAARVAALELAKSKIRVNVISAGVVNTSMSQKWTSPLSEDQKADLERSHLLGIGEPKDIAGPIAFLLSDEARWITGTTLVVDGGLSVR